MKTIKCTSEKDRMLPAILIPAFFLILATLFMYVQNTQTEKLEQFDILRSCDSIPVPVFSVPEGIYDQPFELEIQAPAGYDIFYTTDGSIPTIRSNRYKTSITVDPQENPNRIILAIPTSLKWKPPHGQQNHSFALRARCFKSGTGYGKVKNVIYSTSTIRQHDGFHVVHVLIEADSLFSQEDGIYVLGQKYYSKKTLVTEKIILDERKWMDFPANYHQRGKKWTRPAEFILMDLSGKTLFEQSVLLCNHGGATRSFPEKSLRIMSDSIRGEAVWQYRFFDNLPYETFTRILLRNSGNDMRIGPMFRDAMQHQIVKGLGLDIQDYAPAVVYINGNYWGIHNIRERMDEHYLAIKYGSAFEKINIIELTGAKMKLLWGNEQSLQSFEELIDYIKINSMSDEKAYQHVCSQMDIDNFINYVIVETFFANTDWGVNNMKFYRIEQQTETMRQQNIEAGKWRWLLIDLDLGMSENSTLIRELFRERVNFISINMFNRIKKKYWWGFINHLFYGLLENPEFKEKFLLRYEFVIRNCLTTENILQHIDFFEELYQGEIGRHIARWRQINMRQWHGYISQMKEFARERPEIVLEQLKAL